LGKKSSRYKRKILRPLSKFSPGIILWGAISTEGLFPREEPIWFTDWLKAYCKRHKQKKQTMSAKGYSDFLRYKIFPLLEDETNGMLENYIWEDDGDSKHRADIVLNTVDEFFNERVPIARQAPKMADIWPIEKVWAYLKERMRGHDCQSLDDIKKKVSELWKEITPDMCNQCINNIPVSLGKVIKLNGAQVHKED